jgi:hypothetical protein
MMTDGVLLGGLVWVGLVAVFVTIRLMLGGVFSRSDFLLFGFLVFLAGCVFGVIISLVMVPESDVLDDDD